MKDAASSGLSGRFLGFLATVLFLGLTLGACDSALESDPPFTTSEDFYNNAEDALAAVNGAYAQTENLMLDNEFHGAMEFPTAAVLYEGGPRSSAGALNNFVMTPGNSVLSSIYQDSYVAVNRANAVLENVPGIESMDAGLRARIVAEARFLRALNYFNLVALFGGVPLVESEVVDLTDLEKPAASAADVYSLIIEDLQTAISDLPPESAYSGDEIGRASEGAARTLLAKVYLQRGSLSAANGVTGDLQIAQPEDYQNALDQLNQVINSGEYSLVSDYRELFVSPPTGGEIDEVVFALQSNYPAGVFASSGLPCDVSPKRSNLSAQNRDYFGSELPFFTSFPETDARKAATFTTEYEIEGQTVTYDAENPDGDGYEDFTPAFYKYGVAEERCADANDFLWLRYADVLLMKAEALNEINQGPTAAAYEAVNQVQERAGAEPLESGLGYEAFREALYVERRRELAFEGHGWRDGQRFFETFERRVEEVEGERFPAPYWIETVDVQDPKHRLMPIPQQALDRNSELTQNPEYGAGN